MNTEISTNDNNEDHTCQDIELSELDLDNSIDELDIKPQMLEVVSKNFQGKQLIID
jgi:hypothetical protein